MGGDNVVPVVLLEITNEEITEDLKIVSRDLTTHFNIVIAPSVNVVEGTMSSRLIKFGRMNSPMFFGSKIVEDPQEFLDRVYEVSSAMG